MTPLRKRMTEDLQLKGYSPKTQALYLQAVQKLAQHCGQSPALIQEEELRAYFLHLTRVECCAPGTLKIAQAGIKFCFAITLQKHWPVLGLIRPGKEQKLPVVLSRAEVRQGEALLRVVQVLDESWGRWEYRPAMRDIGFNDAAPADDYKLAYQEFSTVSEEARNLKQQLKTRNP